MNYKRPSWQPFTLFLSAVVFFGFNAVTFAGTCPDGILAYWSLEQSSAPYYDIDPASGSNAVCSAQCPDRIDDGAVGYANRFEGSLTGLRVPGGVAFNWTGTDNFSIELWLRRMGSTDSDQVVIGRTDGNFNWNISLGSTGVVRFYLNDSTNSVLLESSKRLSTSQSLLGARWHHIAVVRNGDSGMTRLFVDGQLTDSSTERFQGGFSSNSAVLAIAWSGDEGNAGRFSGDLDEIAVYQHALTEEEIRSHYYLARDYCGLYDYPVDIMPLGNSITFDQRITEDREWQDRPGYRYDLWQQLNDNYYWFNFIGSQQAGQNLDPNFDPDNAGFPGIRSDQLLYLLQTSYNRAGQPRIPGSYVGNVTEDTRYLDIFPTDVVLLHIGTNFGRDRDASQNADDVRAILNEIDDYNRNITVIVVRIIHNVETDFSDGVEIENNRTHQFNDMVENIVDERIAAGDKILKVDMEDGASMIYIEGEDMYDHLHPSPSGYAKMASQWHDRLDDFLPRVIFPQITSDPVEEAAVGRLYEYRLTADGTPKPHFRLEIAPDNMAIDAESGLITWTASDNVGESVTVRVVAQNIDPTEEATRWAEVDVQEFQILVTETGPEPEEPEPENGGGSGGGCFIQSTVCRPTVHPVWPMTMGIVSLLTGYFGYRRRI